MSIVDRSHSLASAARRDAGPPPHGSSPELERGARPAFEDRPWRLYLYWLARKLVRPGVVVTLNYVRQMKERAR